ncbi:uncharacterized protein PAC_15718 [Phialocephala subalpina]|uniref:Zn(2)-C6 fungal-type domain-containing protein n=1 Tax=Phialocephala subalpina TaxID=576137 RepID=A0A1L7XLC2_9HELO|nr:uncharacterized protein PAC_15718 [Phialocephala subalpina]
MQLMLSSRQTYGGSMEFKWCAQIAFRLDCDSLSIHHLLTVYGEINIDGKKRVIDTLCRRNNEDQKDASMRPSRGMEVIPIRQAYILTFNPSSLRLSAISTGFTNFLPSLLLHQQLDLPNINLETFRYSGDAVSTPWATGKRKYKPRASLACDTCRAKKAKCDQRFLCRVRKGMYPDLIEDSDTELFVQVPCVYGEKRAKLGLKKGIEGYQLSGASKPHQTKSTHRSSTKLSKFHQDTPHDAHFVRPSLSRTMKSLRQSIAKPVAPSFMGIRPMWFSLNNFSKAPDFDNRRAFPPSTRHATTPLFVVDIFCDETSEPPGSRPESPFAAAGIAQKSRPEKTNNVVSPVSNTPSEAPTPILPRAPNAHSFTSRWEEEIWVFATVECLPRNQMHFLALYNAVLAVGALTAPVDALQDQRAELDIGTEEAQKNGTQRLLGDVFEVCSFEGAQTLLLLSVYCQHALKLHPSHMHSGMALRTAIAIGLLTTEALVVRIPWSFTMILMAVEMVGFAAIRGVYVWENRKRKESFETWDEEQVRAEDRGKNGRRGDQRCTFVYSY